MRLTSAICTGIRKAARRASVGAPIRFELASRYGYNGYVLPDGHRDMTNLLDLDVDRTDLSDKMLFGPQNIEDSKNYPGSAIVEVWTYDRDELLDTVYVGIVNGKVLDVSSARYEKVKNAVIAAQGK